MFNIQNNVEISTTSHYCFHIAIHSPNMHISAQTNDSRKHWNMRRDINCSRRSECEYYDIIYWRCVCNDGWATYPEPDSTTTDPMYCNYEQKLQLVAFLLSFSLDGPQQEDFIVDYG